jgi:hypothetical protein
MASKYPLYPSTYGACKSRLDTASQARVPISEEEVAQYESALVLAKSYQSVWEVSIHLAAWIGAIFSGYFVSWIWNRSFPVHKTPTQADFTRVRHAYWLITGTTLFIPSIIASIAFVSAEIVQRLAPTAVVELAPMLIFFGLLPLVVTSILVADRMNNILNDDRSWKTGTAVAIIFTANIVTNGLVMGLLFLVALMI